MKKKDQDRAENTGKNPITEFMEGDLNAAITLAELTEQIQSLDIKLDKIQCDILSQKQSAKRYQENREKIKSDISSIRRQIDYSREDFNATKNEILMKTKANFILSLITVITLITTAYISVFAHEISEFRYEKGTKAQVAATAAPQKDTIHLSDRNTTHIRFDSDIKYVDLSNKVIMAKVVEGSKDIVAVRAREPFDFSTSISCLESDGDMHSYIVVYDENPENLIIDCRNLSRMEEYVRQVEKEFETDVVRNEDSQFDMEDMKYARQEFYHIGSQRYDIHCFCKNIFVDKDVYYFVFDLKNFSKTSYELSDPRFAIESRKRGSRGLKYEKQLYPRVVSACNKIEPGSSGKMVFAFEKFSVPRDQVFNVYVYEKDGTRNFRISILGRDIKDATVLKDLGCKRLDMLP